jgi:hypothetical protein
MIVPPACANGERFGFLLQKFIAHTQQSLQKKEDMLNQEEFL